MRLRSFQGRCLTSVLILLLTFGLTVCSCAEKIFTQVNPPGNVGDLGSYLGAGAGAWGVVQEALNLESQLSPVNALNDYDPYSTNQYMAAAVNYWKRICGGDICSEDMPISYHYAYDGAGGGILEKCAAPGTLSCGSGGFQCSAFVYTVYALAGHQPPRPEGYAYKYYSDYARIPGWKTLPVQTSLPLPGDIIVWSHGTFGHVGIVVDVHPPTEGAPIGSMAVAEANAPATFTTPNANLSAWVNAHAPAGTPLLQLPLLLNKGASPAQNTYSVPMTIWNTQYDTYTVLGYVRNPSLDSVNTPSAALVRTPQWVFWSLCPNDSSRSCPDPAAFSQYDQKTYDYATWEGSACSAAAMTEVINAYNRYYASLTGQPANIYRIADILRVEATTVAGYRNGQPTMAITSGDGLEFPANSMVVTMEKFHFHTFWGGHDDYGSPDSSNALSLDQIIAIANTGIPVIVGLDQGLWKVGGHYMVVQGGDNQNIQLVDSSALNKQTVSRQTFLSWWSGLYVVTYPDNEPGIPADPEIQAMLSTSASESNTSVAPGVWVQLAYFDAMQAGIKPEYYIRQIAIESGFNENAPTTGNDDEGIAQASPSTIPGYDLKDAVQALAGAARYDASNFRSYLGSGSSTNNEIEAYRRTFAAYNAGGGAVAGVLAYGNQWLNHLTCTTQNYVSQAINGLGHSHLVC